MNVTYTTVLPVRDETVDFLADLLAAECQRRAPAPTPVRCPAANRAAS